MSRAIPQEQFQMMARKMTMTFDDAPAGESRAFSRVYLLSIIAYPAAVVHHLIALLMFWSLGAFELVAFNVFSIAIYLACFLVVRRYRNVILPFLVGPVAEVVAHALLATLAFGLSSGWFLWVLVPTVIVSFLPIWFGYRIAASVLLCVVFALVALIGLFFEPWYQISSVWQVVFVAFNTLGCASLVATLFAINTRAATNAELALEAEHARSEALLYNLLPEEIAARLKQEPDKTIADSLPKVAILFADIVDFTPRSGRMSPEEIVGFLNRVFTAFDELAEKHGLEKIKTIGDAYMVAAGMPNPSPNPVHRVAEMALDMLEVTRTLSDEVDVRIGLHAGPAVAGVIGNTKLFYDVWGETVNTASRMESHGEPGRIQVTGAVKAELEGNYRFVPRGTVQVKGMGPVETWWLTKGG
ncbi:MAG: adenylate/guanylate cyclase domain-containing protein [Paracoccaceae bacterium]